MPNKENSRAAVGSKIAQEQSNPIIRKPRLTSKTATYVSEEFKVNHRDAYNDMVRLAFDMKTRYGRASINRICEECRYTPYPSFTRTREQFKISNTLRAALARQIVKENPELEGVFLFRPSDSDSHFDMEKLKGESQPENEGQEGEE